MVIRSDGSETVGMGHVMRTLALAEALRDLGVRVVYVCANDGARKVIQLRGFGVIVLGTDQGDMLGELPKLRAVLARIRAGFVFVDSFYATDVYFEEVRTWCPVGSFAFGRTFSQGLDLVVSYLPSTDEEWLRSRFAASGVKLLVGTEFVPLRSEFFAVPLNPLPLKPSEILVMSGGSDPLGMCERVAGFLGDDPYWDDVEKHVVLGPAFRRAGEVEARIRGGRTTVHRSVGNMAALMARCDLAITACGYSVFELAACGVPMVVFATSADQVENGFAPGLMEYAGDARSDADGIAERACFAAKRLAESVRDRQAMREAFRRCGLDGRGAQRIARAVVGSMER